MAWMSKAVLAILLATAATIPAQFASAQLPLPEAPKVEVPQTPSLPTTPSLPSPTAPSLPRTPSAPAPSLPGGPAPGIQAPGVRLGASPQAGGPGASSVGPGGSAGSQAAPRASASQSATPRQRRAARRRESARRFRRSVRALSGCLGAVSSFDERVLRLRAGIGGVAAAPAARWPSGCE